MGVPAWSEAVPGQPAAASQLNQFLGLHPAHLAYQGTAIEENTATATGSLATDTQHVAQSFVMSGTQIDRVALSLSIGGVGADVTVEICADNAGAPGASVASIVVPRDFLAITARLVSVPLYASGLTDGATYWVVVSKAGDATDRTFVESSAGAPVAATSPDGVTWSATATRLLFGVYAGATGNPLAASEDDGERWYEVVMDAQGRVGGVYECVGTLRNVRTLVYDDGMFVGVV